MVCRESNEMRYELVAEPTAAASPESPLSMLRRVLRGRYLLTGAVAALFACAGGIAGYGLVRPKFESSGLVHVRGAVAPILYSTPTNQAPSNFDSYLSSLVTYIKSQPVLAIATERPEMRAIEWPEGADGIAALQRAISVHRGRREQLIKVSATHGDPDRAQIAANAVLAAVETYTNSASISGVEQMTALTARESELKIRIEHLRTNLLATSDQYGATAVRTMHDNKVGHMVDLEARLSGIRNARTLLELGDIDPDANSVLASIISNGNDHTARLREQEAMLVGEMQTYGNKYSARHPLMQELERKLDAIRIQIEMRSNTSGLFAENGDSSPKSVAERLDQLEKRYSRERDETRAGAAVLAQQVSSIRSIEDQISLSQERLTETRTRMDQLAIEAKAGESKRVSVEAWAAYPVVPVADRRQGLATAGIVGGFIAGIGLIFLMGLTDGRLRFINELESLHLEVPLIGILPEVGDDMKSRQQAHRNVHQLRNLLELRMSDPSRNVYAITSSGYGDGKTSLAIGLATSFAAAGRRTLVIDADITGRRLTHELGLKSASGLCESIGPDNRSGKVHLTGQPELWAMPVGSTDGINPEDLSRDRLAHLLEALRSRFDAIIIDTGPIRSSIEACLVSAVADRAVMVVSRNQTVDRLRAAVDRLEQVGAQCAGIVFNRAQQSDLIRKAEDLLPRESTNERIVPLTQTSARPSIPPPVAVEDESAAPVFRLGDTDEMTKSCPPPRRKAA